VWEGRSHLAGAYQIRLDRIRPDPEQPRQRIDPDRQRELTDSVRRLGIMQPIAVRYVEGEDVYRVIAGERRFLAAREAGLSEVPCWVQSPKEEEILVRQIVENWQRLDLEPLEIAEALATLRDGGGHSQKELAELTGKPESEISRLLSLLNLTPEVHQQARQSAAGTFTKRHLTAMARLPQEDQQEVMIEVKTNRLTAQETERAVRDRKRKAAGVKTAGAPYGKRLRYLTEKATVLLTFRRRDVALTDVLAALEEVRAQVQAGEDDPKG
jgi:ParB family transcriptional regulator, chromosome partitioning protein